MSKSEVARLRRQLLAQTQAAWLGLYGFAEVGRHQAITSQMERMGETLQSLAEKVGELEAARILIEVESRVEKESSPR